MKTIYGVPVVTYEDLFSTSLRPHDLMTFVREYEKDIMSDLRGEITRLEDLFKSEFVKMRVDLIPLDIIEEYALYKLTVEAAKRASRCIVTPYELWRLHDSVAESEKSFEDFIENREFYFDENKMHLAMVRDAKESNLIDSCLCVPRVILAKLHQPTTYKCCKCDFTIHVLNDLPDMMYTIENNDVEYYCMDCCNTEKKMVHVGDSFSNPYKEH